MLKTLLHAFSRKSRKDYVPKIFKHPRYNPAQKGGHAKVQPPPEVLQLHKEFYDEVDKYEKIAARNALFDNIREKFQMLQGYHLQPDEFEEALTKFDPVKDLPFIQLNIQECIRRCAFVEDVTKLRYFLHKACYFGLPIKADAFEKALKGLYRFSAHYAYHKRSPFEESEKETHFCYAVQYLYELYKDHWFDDISLTGKMEDLLKQIYDWICLADKGTISESNLKRISEVLAQFNQLKNKEGFDVSKLQDLGHKTSSNSKNKKQSQFISA